MNGLEAELRGVREELTGRIENQLSELSERERQLHLEQNKTQDLEVTMPHCLVSCYRAGYSWSWRRQGQTL